MADQTTLNYEQIAKVRSVLSLNIYSQDSGTRTFINGNNFRVETPMTIPIDGVETAIGHVNIEGSIFYDLTVEGIRILELELIRFTTEEYLILMLLVILVQTIEYTLL